MADQEKRRRVELALERARYEAKRAERQFDRVEPENRLVAVELEGRWNGALAQVAELESRLQELRGEAATAHRRTKATVVGDGKGFEEIMG